MEYILHYHSINTYQELVNEAIIEFLILPETSEDQLVSESKIKNSFNLTPFYYTNVFGFNVCRFRLSQPFKEFKLEMTVKVNKHSTGTKYGYTFTAEACWDMLHHLDFEIDHHLFLSASYFTQLPPNVLEVFPKLEQGVHVFDFLRELNQYVHEYLTYEPHITDVYTRVTDILELRKGVCQDYAHLFISIARYNKIPTRYVSGYLNQQMGYLGAQKMHAWVECFVPGVGWLGFDPTNLLQADQHYIKVAHGCDYSDCSPLKGIVKTNGTQQTDHAVVVQSQQ
jgi:transglutaminase-like putative cysteine protease